MLFMVLSLMINVCYCDRKMIIQMPNVDIEEKDAYMCYATSVSELSGYSLVSYEFDTTKGVSHHIGLAACEDYNSNMTYWDCKKDHGHICKGRAVSLHGQAGIDVLHSRMAFQDDVGVSFGDDAHINYVILQVHYRNPVNTSEHASSTTNATLSLKKTRKPYTKQTMLLGSDGYIPPMSTNHSCEMVTRWTGIPVKVYSYSIHTHDLGVMLEGYLIRNGTTTLIGRQSPQHHGTATYKVEGEAIEIVPGDVIAARCIFKNPSNENVNFGSGHNDEMCNYSLNFKYSTDDAMIYPRSLRVYQNCQQVTWCQNDVIESAKLCGLSKYT